MFIKHSILSRCQFSPICLYSQHNPKQNICKLFCGCQQTEPKVYVEMQKTQSSQQDIQEKQSWRTDTASKHTKKL